MKRIVRFLGPAAAAILFAGATYGAESQRLVAIRVINLSSQIVVAFSMTGTPFTDVGLEQDTGDPLTPDFAIDGLMDYELYWRLQDGSVHGGHVDLRAALPSVFRGNVAITLHNDHVGVSWFNMDPAWSEYTRLDNYRRLPQPTGPRYSTCEGEILSHPVTLAVWRSYAAAVRQRHAATGDDERQIQEGRCNMSWYLRRADGRERKRLDELTARELREKWAADIAAYQADKMSVVP